MTTRITIPKSIKGVTDRLTDLDGLVTAKEWERAAIVFAHTDARPKAGRPGAETVSTDRFSFQSFASLGIQGLRSKNTVERYHAAWKTTGIEITPGQSVALPDSPFPPDLDNSGRSIKEQDRRDALIAQASKDGVGQSKVLDVASNPKAIAVAIKADPKTAEAVKKALADSGQIATTAEVVAEAINVNPAIREAARKVVDEKRHEDFVAKQKAYQDRMAARAKAKAEMEIEEEGDDLTDLADNMNNLVNAAEGFGVFFDVGNVIERVGEELEDQVPRVATITNPEWRELIIQMTFIVDGFSQQIRTAAGDNSALDNELDKILKGGQ